MTKATIQRQKLIADFIDTGKVSSQNQLKGVLKKNGIIITQATLSRDLSELGAVKKRLNNGRLVYLLPKNQDNNAQLKIAKKALDASNNIRMGPNGLERVQKLQETSENHSKFLFVEQALQKQAMRDFFLTFS